MKILEKQAWHLSYVIVSLLLFILILPTHNYLDGIFLGLSTQFWTITAIVIGILHQVYVMICWRFELKYRWVTKKWGPQGFKIYVVGFFILFTGRIISIIFVAIANRQSMDITPIILYILAGIITIPMVYAMYSVVRYFGVYRAAGADHFDPSYREKPFERRGIYKYTKNGMYIYALLIIWIPGLLFASKTALLLALFNHAYVWVHYFTLELPDMRRIYKNKSKNRI